MTTIYDIYVVLYDPCCTQAIVQSAWWLLMAWRQDICNHHYDVSASQERPSRMKPAIIPQKKSV